MACGGSGILTVLFSLPLLLLLLADGGIRTIVATLCEELQQIRCSDREREEGSVDAGHLE